MKKAKEEILSDAIKTAIESQKEVIRLRKMVIGMCICCVFLAVLVIVK